jgi:RND family efflux transporter MFP subunit
VILVLFNLYLVLLFALVKLKLITLNLFWKVSPAIWLLVLLVGCFIPMTWGAPSGPVLVLRQSVQIVPDVAGEVIDVPVAANVPLKANDVLFRIDPVPFEAQVQALEAQLAFAELRFGQFSELQRREAGRAFDVQQREAEVKQLRAQVLGAKWNLDKTVVRAPADGYVTNVTLRKGARVASLPLAPVMAFIDTSETILAVEIGQTYARYIATGQEVELTFKFMPGRIYTGRVQAVLQAISTGQEQPSGLAATPRQIEAAPFVVRVVLDDAEFATTLPAGSTGQAAIYTDRVKPTHIIRRVLMRQIAIVNYINPF